MTRWLLLQTSLPKEGKGGDEEGKTADLTPAELTASGTEEGKGGDAAEGGEDGGTATKEDSESTPAAVQSSAVQKTKMVKVKKTVKVFECKLLMDLNNVGPEMNDLALASFMRSKDGVVPTPADVANAHVLQENLEFNYMTGDYLYNLANLMKHVYIPAISTAEVGATPLDPEAGKGKDVDAGLRSDLDSGMNKFYHQLHSVAMQSRGDVSIAIPTIDISSNDTQSVVSMLEGALEDWTVVMSNAVEGELRKDSSGKRTPLGEIEFWRNRAASSEPSVRPDYAP